MQGERRNRIRSFIDSRGEATVAQLLELCGSCSSMTIWRDLQALELEGVIRRTRGGAISMRSIQPDIEGLYSQRARENTEAKHAIARATLPFVKPGQAIYLDGGSTMMCLAKLLQDQHYTVITSGANLAIELSRNRSNNVICVGGQISGNTLSFSGPQAEAVLKSVNIDTAIMGASGFSLQSGFTSGSFSERELKHAVMHKAARVIMLMDSSKLDKSLPFTFATMADIDVFITESPPPHGVMLSAGNAGVEVIVAQ